MAPQLSPDRRPQANELLGAAYGMKVEPGGHADVVARVGALTDASVSATPLNKDLREAQQQQGAPLRLVGEFASPSPARESDPSVQTKATPGVSHSGAESAALVVGTIFPHVGASSYHRAAHAHAAAASTMPDSPSSAGGWLSGLVSRVGAFLSVAGDLALDGLSLTQRGVAAAWAGVGALASSVPERGLHLSHAASGLALTGVASWLFNASMIGDLWRIPRAIREGDWADVRTRLADLGKMAAIGTIALALPALGAGAIPFGFILGAAALDHFLALPGYEKEHDAARGKLFAGYRKGLEGIATSLGEHAALRAAPFLRDLPTVHDSLDAKIDALVREAAKLSPREMYGAAKDLGGDIAREILESQEWADYIGMSNAALRTKLHFISRRELAGMLGKDRRAAMNIHQGLHGKGDLAGVLEVGLAAGDRAARSVASDAVTRILGDRIAQNLAKSGDLNPIIAQNIQRGILDGIAVEVRDS